MYCIMTLDLVLLTYGFILWTYNVLFILSYWISIVVPVSDELTLILLVVSVGLTPSP